MSLADILASTDLRVVIDSRLPLRSESDRTLLATKLLKADSASDFLNRALALEETPVAAIPDSGTVYLLSPGTHGLICLQGSSANKAQKAAMEKLAKAYSEATGLMLPDWYVPKLEADKIVKEFVAPADDLSDSPDDSAVVDPDAPVE